MKDLIGQTFGLLTVESKAGTILQGKSKTKRTLWNCKCKCGNYTTATTNDLTRGKRISCGCKKQDNGIAKRKTNIGDIYGFMQVEEMVGRNTEGRILYRCKCLRCGNTGITTGKNLRSGWTTSCGCVKQEYMKHFGNTNFRDLSGQQFGYLLVQSRAPTRYSKAGNQTTMWNCKCLLCGNYTVVAANCLTVPNPTRSCGCLRMSNGELEIDKILKENNVEYIFDYSFDDLISPRSLMPLRFDFALFKDGILKCLIEFQGLQHYTKCNNKFGEFQREVTDKMKIDYCLEKQIQLFTIKYDEDIPLIMKIILDKMQII